MDEAKTAVAERGTIECAELCLCCGRPMWEPDPPTWFDGGRCGSLSPLVRGLAIEDCLRVSLCDLCLARARTQGRVRLVTRNRETGEHSSKVWGQ
jgi:hypothetical protein